MKCPLKFKIEELTSTQARFYNDACLGVECAWWSGVGGMCSIPELALSLTFIHGRLQDIAKELTLVRGK